MNQIAREISSPAILKLKEMSLEFIRYLTDSNMTSQIEKRILEIVSDIAMTSVSMDDQLLDTNLIDSIAAVNLALQIEDEFHCSIPPQEIMERIKTTRSLVEYVIQHQ